MLLHIIKMIFRTAAIAFCLYIVCLYLRFIKMGQFHRTLEIWFMCSQRHFIFCNMCFPLFSVCSLYHTPLRLGTQSFPSAFTAMSFTNDTVSGIPFFTYVFQPRHGASAELQQNLWKISTKIHREMLSPPARYLAQITFPVTTTDSCFQGRQSRTPYTACPCLPTHHLLAWQGT